MKLSFQTLSIDTIMRLKNKSWVIILVSNRQGIPMHQCVFHLNNVCKSYKVCGIKLNIHDNHCPWNLTHAWRGPAWWCLKLLVLTWSMPLLWMKISNKNWNTLRWTSLGWLLLTFRHISYRNYLALTYHRTIPGWSRKVQIYPFYKLIIDTCHHSSRALIKVWHVLWDSYVCNASPVNSH